MMLDPFVTLTAQFFLALLLFAAGVHKGADLSRLVAAISAYRMLPAHFERSVAWLVIATELTIGAALLVPSTREAAASAAAGVFAAYLVVVGLSLVRGHRNVDCGCSFHGRVAPLSGAHLVRNGVLVMLAVLASMPDSGRIVVWLDGVQITAAVLCLALIYLSLDSLLAHKITVESLET